MRSLFLLGLWLFQSDSFAQAPAARLNPAIQSIVAGISEQRIAATLKRLESFGTRHVMSEQGDPERGIGAAQRWIEEQFAQYSPRLRVHTEKFTLKKGAGRGSILRDTELANVIAVLPGELEQDRYVLVSGHYDSLNIAQRQIRTEEERLKDLMKDGAGESEARAYLSLFPMSETRGRIDEVASAAQSFAPGVTDDGSGIAGVLELARVMSRYKFDKTVVFIAFTAEEIGSEGANAYLARHKREQIEALLNNDIIGSDISGNGRASNSSVRVFSAGPEDSPARALARYTKEISERYVPSMKADLIMRRDRFMRGGDHTPFAEAGFAAIRFTTPSENFSNQHTATDTFANASTTYTARVVRMNAAVLASLALAPKPPAVSFTWSTGKQKGRRVPLLSRGKSGYDAVLRWIPNEEPDLAGYSIVIRSTTSPLWEREIWVGNVTTFTLPDFSIDDVVMGVKAVDRDGNQSLVSSYDLPSPRMETAPAAARDPVEPASAIQ
jgi:hypothetical protein